VVTYILEGVFGFFETLSYKIITLFKKTEFVRQGQCQMTGQCCNAIGMEFPKSWQRYPRIINVIKKWHYLRYNFKFHGIQGNMLVYECQYLTKDNRCGIQKFKPKLCRDFPKIPYWGYTKLHKGCGFSYRKRDGRTFDEVLVKKQSEEKFEV